MTDTAVLDAPTTEVETGTELTVKNHEKLTPDDGSNKDKVAHLAFKKDIEKAIFDGVPCTAFCGKTWIPGLDNPKQYPVCPRCKEIYAAFDEGGVFKPHGPEDGPTWDADE